MNYKHIYEQLTSNKHTRKKGKSIYYEEHHINPRCMGGVDEVENLVLLTAREHFLAHWCLVKICPNNHKLIYALNRMCNGNKPQDYNSKLFELARLKYVETLKNDKVRIMKMRKRLTGNIWIKKGDSCKRVHLNEIDMYISGGWVKGRIIKKRAPHSQETKNKIKIGNTGKIRNENVKKAASKLNKSKRWVNNGIKNKHITEYEKYIAEGWEFGRLSFSKEALVNMKKAAILQREKRVGIKRGPTSQSQKKAVSERTKGSKWINKNGECLRVKEYQIDYFIQNGWSLGRK